MAIALTLVIGSGSARATDPRQGSAHGSPDMNPRSHVVGRPPFNPVGPPPMNPAGPPPLNAVGPPPLNAVGPPPFNATGAQPAFSERRAFVSVVGDQPVGPIGRSFFCRNHGRGFSTEQMFVDHLARFDGIAPDDAGRMVFDDGGVVTFPAE
jgi:hypothetical protein